uniref:Uncharacterized protein n=1 Tax=Rhizophora mucronata TaxID=61149 RepID=A0A2P2QLW0_RHIMU
MCIHTSYLCIFWILALVL